MFSRSLGALAISGCMLCVIAGCDSNFSGFGSCPDNERETLELWSVGLDGTNRNLLHEDLPLLSTLIDVLQDDRVIFSGSYDGLYSLNTRTDQITQILSTDGEGYVVSRDGDYVAYIREGTDLWIASMDGSEHKPLVKDTVRLEQPIWVKGSQAVAYRRRVHPDISEGGVRLFHLSDSTSERLTPTTVYWFDISADGSTVVYDDRIRVNGEYQNAVLLRGSAGLGQVSKVLEAGVVPQLTPDNQQIVYLSERLPVPSNAIHVMNSDGSNSRTVFDEVDLRNVPHLTPDGGALVLELWSEIIKVNLQTGSTTVLSRLDDHELDWHDRWTSVTPSFDHAIIDRENAGVYYLVSKRLFSECS